MLESSSNSSTPCTPFTSASIPITTTTWTNLQETVQFETAAAAINRHENLPPPPAFLLEASSAIKNHLSINVAELKHIEIESCEMISDPTDDD
ncbi:hypothetical protein FQA39_LY08381 [Lamprigera yunnana]|nr:hypothetical protein FQA39_LY08381 [Lamprigera yunnana]